MKDFVYKISGFVVDSGQKYAVDFASNEEIDFNDALSEFSDCIEGVLDIEKNGEKHTIDLKDTNLKSLGL